MKCQRRAVKGMGWIECPQNTTRVCIMSWATMPIDRLDNSMQHADFHSHSFADLARADGPLYLCLADYFFMLTSDDGFGSASGLLPSIDTIVRQFRSTPGVTVQWAEEFARNRCVEMAAIAWTRLYVPQRMAPRRFWQASEAPHLVHEFYAEDECCLDKTWSVPLRKALPRIPEFQRFGVPLCQDIWKHTRMTNMICEHGLKSVKTSSSKHCSAERMM